MHLDNFRDEVRQQEIGEYTKVPNPQVALRRRSFKRTALPTRSRRK